MAFQVNLNVENPGAVVTYVTKSKVYKTVSLTGTEIIHKYKDKGREITKKIPAASQEDLRELFEIKHYMVIEVASTEQKVKVV
jgi:hypothetical protein